METEDFSVPPSVPDVQLKPDTRATKKKVLMNVEDADLMSER